MPGDEGHLLGEVLRRGPRKTWASQGGTGHSAWHGTELQQQLIAELLHGMKGSLHSVAPLAMVLFQPEKLILGHFGPRA